MRNLAQLKGRLAGRIEFGGVKGLALRRMIAEAGGVRPVVLAVLPESPAFRAAFLSPDSSERFDQMLTSIGAEHPGVRFLRLDREPSLGSDQLYFDLVHLNVYGREIATGRMAEFLVSMGSGR